MATLVVAGNFVQALEALIAHRILRATSTVEKVSAQPGKFMITKVRVDGEKYNDNIAAWLNEPVPIGPGSLEPGVLIRAQWHNPGE